MKKYKIHPPLVERIFSEESNKKDPVKSAKTRLHQLYGAYLQGNTHKKAEALLDAENRESILSLHASTKERLPYMKEFYDFAAKHTCAPETILDLGCGFNPFALPLMPAEFTKNLQTYHAYDIDLRTKDLLNRFFESQGLPQAAKCADLAVETPPEAADVAFLFKLLPVIEAQSAGRGFELANALNARFLIITYPLKSLGGREKGMEKNYSASFESAMANGLLNNFTLVSKQSLKNELIYILRGTSSIPSFIL